MTNTDVASKRLVGIDLEDGWKVVDIVQRTGAQTGAFFSQGYLARRKDGSEAFLKAMDFSEAAKAADFARAIEHLARQFNFERDILDFCQQKRMRNVIRSVGGGVVDIGGADNPLDKVQYFLFEPADGDIRKVIESYGDVSLAWALRVLHEAAVGMRQLHTGRIAHQDFKPSNILAFENEDVIKVGDLGCASMRESSCPRDNIDVPGQRSYAPPEQLYRHLHPDWIVRRIGSDMYQLGAMCCFLLAGVSFNALLMRALSPEHRWGTWGGTYEEVLPHVKAAFGYVVHELELVLIGPQLEEAVPIIRQLCEPELSQRGDPRRIRRGGQQYSIEPYVSRLGGLRRSAEAAAIRMLNR